MFNQPYVLTYLEIEYYLVLMQNQDINIQRDSIQRLFQEIVKGRRLLPFSMQRLETCLESLIQSPVSKVRKWALHLSTSINSEKIIKVCKKQLELENDQENINWILATLSTIYNKEELLNILKKVNKHNSYLDNITELQIDASTVLFSKDKNIPNLSLLIQNLRKSKPEIRSWLTKFYGYNRLAEKKDIHKYIDQNDMLNLIIDGDIGLQEYGMWGLYLHGEQNIKNIPNDILDYSYYYNDTLKWFFPFLKYIPNISSNSTLINTWIINSSLFNRSAKEGLLNLLLSIKFNNKYVEGIVDWYISEIESSVKRLLFNYMILNVRNDLTYTFFSVLENEFENPSVKKLIEYEIQSNLTTELEIINNKIYLKKEEKTMNNFFNGPVNNPVFNDNHVENTTSFQNLYGKIFSSLDYLIDIPEKELNSIKNNLLLANEQIQSSMPKKRILGTALTAIKKFVNEFFMKLAVSTATGYVTNADWSNLISEIEAFFRKLN